MLDKEVLKHSKVNNWGFVSHKAAVFQDLKTPPSLVCDLVLVLVMHLYLVRGGRV